MDNCQNQLVLFADRATVEGLLKSLSEEGGICSILPFDRAYHTPLFAAVTSAFHQYYRDVGLQAPKTPLYSCASTDLFPAEAAAVCELAAAQWSSTVRFRETIAQMHGRLHDINDIIRTTDASLILGAGISFPAGPNRAFIDGRVSMGLTDVNKGGFVTIGGSQVGVPPTSIRPFGFMILGGIHFPVGG